MSQPEQPHRYLQIAAALRQRICTGQLPLGTALPSQETLAEEHGVHRETVRQALGVLREEGLIAARRRAPAVVVSTHVHPPEQVPVPDDVAPWMELEPGAPVSRQYRPGYRDGRVDEVTVVYRRVRAA